MARPKLASSNFRCRCRYDATNLYPHDQVARNPLHRVRTSNAMLTMLIYWIQCVCYKTIDTDLLDRGIMSFRFQRGLPSRPRRP